MDNEEPFTSTPVIDYGLFMRVNFPPSEQQKEKLKVGEILKDLAKEDGSGGGGLHIKEETVLDFRTLPPPHKSSPPIPIPQPTPHRLKLTPAQHKYSTYGEYGEDGHTDRQTFSFY